jgi:SAM-dependent methyltransferase
VHGFEDVDSQEDPTAWIGVLDRLRREPFYLRLKARVAEDVGFRAGLRYLEIGAGTGDDALSAANEHGCTVIGVDRSQTMVREAQRRGLRTATVATAERLPFPDSVFDGCWAERLFQHLDDPTEGLHEVIRVLAPGGRIVVADPDYGTQTLEFPERGLTERVMRYRAEVSLRSGTIAHRMQAMFHCAGLSDVNAKCLTLRVQDPESYDRVFGLRSWPRSAMRHGWFSLEDVNRWETLYDRCVSAGAFSWTVDFFITSGEK